MAREGLWANPMEGCAPAKKFSGAPQCKGGGHGALCSDHTDMIITVCPDQLTFWIRQIIGVVLLFVGGSEGRVFGVPQRHSMWTADNLQTSGNLSTGPQTSQAFIHPQTFSTQPQTNRQPFSNSHPAVGALHRAGLSQPALMDTPVGVFVGHSGVQ